MEAAAALAQLKAMQIPLDLLMMLQLTGPLFPPERIIKNNSCFDYIVVGGGTAGCAVAARLSEDSNSVLLIEAGGDPPIEQFLPPFFPLAPMSPLDWNYTSVFDSYAASSQSNFTKLTAGKVLGGSSTINHFVEVRGAIRDYNRWAEIIGDVSWRYENVLPYFKKFEKLEDVEIKNSPYGKFHGTKGPMADTRQPKIQAEKYLDAFNETGNPVLLDVNGNVTIGYAQGMLILSSSGIRQSSAFAYLTPARNRQNLYVVRYTHATRIIFKEKRAIAVVTIRAGKVYVYIAKKEMILSCGVYNTPQLLMLSGVGLREHLETFNIEVKADLPVGDNYQDQLSVPIVYKTAASNLPPPPETTNLTQFPFPAIIGLKALNPIQTYADYQVFALLLAHDLPYLILTCAIVFQLRPDICDQFNNKAIGHDSLFNLIAITKPASTGTVRLYSKNPFDKPNITTGYLTNKIDVVNIVDYIKGFIKLGNSSFFQEVNAELIDPELPECSNYTFGTDEYWKCYALHTAVSVYHSSSTCPIGAVVDSRLRVKKVTNLRIVDASVMPTLTSGSPHAAVMMIAEKAADMIKEDSYKVINYCCIKRCRRPKCVKNVVREL